MKKNSRKELSLSTTTVRTLTRELAARQLEAVNGGLYKAGNSDATCYTKPAGGCP